ncbi:MAG: hypothetical protein ACRDKJ_07690 [Actinomycetota bacterium]
MRRILLAIATFGLIVWASPALAQSESSNSGASGGGTASSGSSKSSVHITTSGGSSVGVAQGNVSSGSSGSGTNDGGDQSGSASSGGAGSGQTAGLVTPATAVEDGVVNQVNIPALDLRETQTTADRRPDVLTWAIAGVIVIGLVVLYRRLPRATPAA